MIFTFKKISLGFLILFFFTQCAYYNTLFNAKREFKKGIEIIQNEPEKKEHPQANNHFTKTIDKCWKLIEIYSDKSKYADDALLLIIKSEIYLHRIAQAAQHLKQFFAKYPESKLIPEAYLWQGKLYLMQEKVEEGKEYLNRCLATSEDSKIRAQAYYELGNLAFQNNQFQEAIETFERALKGKIDKQYAAFIQYYLAESYYRQGKYKEAISHYKKVEKLSPSLDVEYKSKLNLSLSYAAQKKYKDALKILRKMLTAPRFKNFVPYIKSEIANIYLKQNQVLDAIDLYKEVINSRSRNAGTALASFRLAKIYENVVQNVDSAVYYYGQVKKIYAKFDSVESAESRHLFLSQLKQIRDAIRRDSRLVFRLENDQYFRDSLYKAQLEDSLMEELRKISPELAAKFSTDTLTLDSLQKSPLSLRDSLAITLQDSIRKLDSLRAIQHLDSIRKGLITEDVSKEKYWLKSKKLSKKKNTVYKSKVKKLEKRKLPQIKEDLKNNRYHLAEFFLLEVQNYDSALYHYKNFLATYQDSVLTPKALYSVYYIYTQPGYSDSTKRDSIANILIKNYPKSPFTQDILKRKGLLSKFQQTDSLEQIAHQMFIEAEELYENGLIDTALALYEKIAEMDTDLVWSAKAQLARAWIFEHNLNDVDRAIAEYKRLYDNFDLPEFKSLAAMKTAIPKESISPVKIKSDSMMAAIPNDSSKILSVTPNTRQSVTTGESSTHDLPLVAKTRRYRQWRQARMRK